MPILHISRYSSTSEEDIQKAIDAVKNIESTRSAIIGTHLQDKSIVITSETDDISTNHDSTTKLQQTLSSPQRTLHTTLNSSALHPSSPGTAPIVEYAISFFPSTRVTPSFQSRIHADFLRFEELFQSGNPQDLGYCMGWSEEVEYEGVEGMARAFVLLRGWRTMEDFEESVKTEGFKSAIGILGAWGVPFEMWHVERRA